MVFKQCIARITSIIRGIIMGNDRANTSLANKYAQLSELSMLMSDIIKLPLSLICNQNKLHSHAPNSETQSQNLLLITTMQFKNHMLSSFITYVYNITNTMTLVG